MEFSRDLRDEEMDCESNNEHDVLIRRNKVISLNQKMVFIFGQANINTFYLKNLLLIRQLE